MREPHVTGSFGALARNCDFTAKNFYTISTDTHIGNLVILLASANENAAGAVHFEALFD
jgi:hypothetical protein